MRRLRIDEIPQFLNILIGHMSFVGPRPERPEFVEQLSQQVPFYNERHIVKPGLTGWAQINYPYSSSVSDAKEKLQYDLFYIKNQSIILDISIILKTINAVFNMALGR
jgi:lipopolysaccharide/colanic/teichoic acid biosynthesis glycosyltransferase